jgi:ribose transport system substrate-binding protein
MRQCDQNCIVHMNYACSLLAALRPRGVDSILPAMKILWPYRLRLPRLVLFLLLFPLVLCFPACHSHQDVLIAVIPQTEGNMFWEAAHVGAEVGASSTGTSIYWNAPTREDDVEGQIALVNRIVDGGYQGLVLAPDQALSLISPVRRALAQHIPTVILGSPLPIPPGGDLSYILIDDEQGGQMAADRAAASLRGHGTVALLGINSDIVGIMVRARSFEQALAHNSPGIRIVAKRMGTFNEAHEQQAVEDVLRANPNLDLIVALMGPTLDGSLTALEGKPGDLRIKIIGFDAVGGPPFHQRVSLDSVIQGDTRSMAQQAVVLIASKRAGRPTPALTLVSPKLICRDNVDSPEVHQMLSGDWTLGRWAWSSTQ